MPKSVPLFIQEHQQEMLEVLAARHFLAWGGDVAVPKMRNGKPIDGQAIVVAGIFMAVDSPDWLHPLVEAVAYVANTPREFPGADAPRTLLMRALQRHDAEFMDTTFRLGGGTAVARLVLAPFESDEQTPKARRRRKKT